MHIDCTTEDAAFSGSRAASILMEDPGEGVFGAAVPKSHRMGVVNLGPILELLCNRLDKLQQFLRKPRSLVSLKTLQNRLDGTDLLSA